MKTKFGRSAAGTPIGFNAKAQRRQRAQRNLGRVIAICPGFGELRVKRRPILRCAKAARYARRHQGAVGCTVALIHSTAASLNASERFQEKLPIARSERPSPFRSPAAQVKWSQVPVSKTCGV